jgi:hypothetical protein
VLLVSSYWYDTVRDVWLVACEIPRSRPEALNVLIVELSSTLRDPLLLAGRYSSTGTGTVNDPAAIGAWQVKLTL